MGLTILDAGVLIGFLDRNDAHHEAARAALERALDQNDRLVLPASAYAEALVSPEQAGALAVSIVEDLVERIPIEVSPLDQQVASAAAGLRARHRAIELPDALVIATAQILDADELITTDRRWPTQRKLGIRAAITQL